MKLVGMIFALILLCAADGAKALTVTAPKTIRPYETSVWSVKATEDGVLTILVSDRRGEEQPAVQGIRVRRGVNKIGYDATSYAGMPLKNGACTLTFLFCGDSGATETKTATTQVRAPAPHLQYALPRALTVYQKPNEKWVIDCAVTTKCSVRFEVYQGEKSVLTVRKKLENGGTFKIPWDLKKNGTPVTPGEYRCVVYIVGQKEDAVSFPLTVLYGQEPMAQTMPAGRIAPESLADADIWALMTAPMAVANVPSTEHATIYADTAKKEAVGTVHGQSQALEIIRTEGAQCLIRCYRQEDGALTEGWIDQATLKAVVPDGRYGVLIDLGEQTLTVYENGHPLGAARVSTGRETTEGGYYRGTIPGLFLAVERVAAFVNKGYRCEYAIRIDGGNLIHQIGLDQKTFSAADEIKTLQSKASAGCVRVDYRTDGTFTINAYWLWSHLPCGAPVLVLP